jgi:phosphatidylglycerol---prolipoprotein diacylglyceryl transferase
MHPILINLPIVNHPIYAYGAMLGLAFISGWYLGMYFANREGIPYKVTYNTYVIVIICSLIGARVAHLITNPDTWGLLHERGFFGALFATKCEGLVAYGGYIGGVLSAWVYFRLKKLDFWSIVDCTTPSMVLGLGLTRIGCFLAGCCHGIPTNLPWGISFPPGSPASYAFLDRALAARLPSPPVHPTQLYESLLGFVLFPLSIWALKRRKFTGQAFLLMVPLYAVGRFLLEFIRGDTDRGTVFGLSTSQFVGVVLIVAVIGLYLWRRNLGTPVPTPLSKEQVRQRLIDDGVAKPKSARSAATGKGSGKGKKKKKRG